MLMLLLLQLLLLSFSTRLEYNAVMQDILLQVLLLTRMKTTTWETICSDCVARRLELLKY